MCLPLGIRYSTGSLPSSGRRDADAPLRLVVLAEFDATIAFADDRESLACVLEQLRDARQTAGDVTSLR